MSIENSHLIDKTSCKFTTTKFGEVDGQIIEKYTVDFPGGIKASLITYGGIIQSLYIPSKDKTLKNIVEGFNCLPDYITDKKYTGAIIGRYANRIKHASFPLNNEIIQLSKNESNNHLHGGKTGFHKAIWNCKSIRKTEGNTIITLSHFSMDGTEGYPGNIVIEAKFTFTKDSIQLEYNATSDQDTIINMTHHSYFNLNGIGTESIENHNLAIQADSFWAVDKGGIPIKKIYLENQPEFDFSSSKSFGQQLKKLRNNLGLHHFDHCFILTGKQAAAEVYSPSSGIKMEIITDQEGIQLYNLSKDLNRNTIYPSFCLEPQFFPNAPNSKNSSGAILNKGETYNFNTKYQFSLI